MWRGLYTAATGMISEARRTDIIANNIANAATTGYKKDVAVHSEFEPMLIKRVYDHDDGGNAMFGDVTVDVTKFKGFSATPEERPGIGTLGLGDRIAEIAVDHAQGSFESTGNPFDLAIAGNGFFAIQTPDGIRYTRNGAFFRSQSGVLQDIRGNSLLAVGGGTISIPENIASDKISISPSGTISALQNGQIQQLAQIQLVQFDNRLALQKQGDNLFYAVTGNDGNVAQPQPATGEIMQGMLEKSNTEIVREMVELIHNHRLYEAGSKAVTTQDTMLDSAVNQLGRIGS